jgi:hypothetical protein
LVASASILLLGACDGPNGPNGPLALGIVSGNHQTAIAGDDQLTEPVIGKMVRTPSGSIAWSWLVSPAYADGTTVNGSPVAGAVVCAVSVTEGGLEPFTPCTNTAEDGTAVFFFSPGTKAGEAKSEIRGTVNAQPAVFDTVVAAIQPGPVRFFNFEYTPPSPYVEPGDTVDIRAGLSHTRDAYGNDIAAPAVVSQDGATVRWGWSDTSAQPTATQIGWDAIVPDTTGFRGRERVYYRDICEVQDGSSACMKKYSGREFDLILTVWIGDSNPATTTVSVIFDAPDDPTNR